MKNFSILFLLCLTHVQLVMGASICPSSKPVADDFQWGLVAYHVNLPGYDLQNDDLVKVGLYSYPSIIVGSPPTGFEAEIAKQIVDARETGGGKDVPIYQFPRETPNNGV